MRTEAWWTCTCGEKIYRVGKGRGRSWEEHQAVCPITEEKRRSPPGTYILQGLHIKQHPQGGR